MQQITRIHERDMGHRVPNHESQCRNLHWHRYKIEITLVWDVIMEKWVSQEWMVIDFSYIKTIACNWIDENLDHWYMYQTWDEIWKLAQSMWMKTIEVPFVPTAENIAKLLYDKFVPMFEEQYGNKLKMYKIKLYETPKNFVVYPFSEK